MPRPHRRTLALLVALICAACPIVAQASAEGHGAGPEVWITLAAMLLLAKLGGEVAVRLGQPAVLGELFAGIVLGNLKLAGLGWFVGAEAMPAIEFLAEFGVVLLLFEVGLESTVSEMRKVAPQSGLVAIIGVVAPMVLGFFGSYWLMPQGPISLHLFIGATLCATSVGITARVLKDLGVLDRQETKVVLGAAVIDDVLGLVVLAIVSAVAMHGTMPNTAQLSTIIALAVGFLVGSLLLGAFVMPGVFHQSARLRTPGVLGALSIGLCLLLAGLSAAAGLAAIVGAFAAGLILDDVHVKPFGKHSTHDLEEIMRPIVAVMAPIFFVRTGMVVDLGGIGVESLVLAAALSAIAVVGKLVAGLGVRGQGIDRWTVGIGMIPRGEVGLIFANVGAGIQVNGAPLMQAGEYAAVVLMVMVTTVISPPWLAGRLRKVMAREGSPGGNPPGDKAAGPQTHSGSAKPSASATGAAASLAPQGPQARVVRASDAPASGALSEQDAPERIEVSGAKMMTDLVAEHEAAVRGDEATQPVAQPAGTPDASAAAPDGAGAATGQSGGGAARASGAASGAPEDAELSDIHAGEATEHSGLRRSERAQAWSAPPEAQSAPPKAQ